MKHRLPAINAVLFGTISLIAAFTWSQPVWGQDYLGADAVLQKVEEENAGTNKTGQTGDESSTLRADLAAFRVSSTNLPPAEAAKQWLALADRAAKILDNSGPDMGFSHRIGPADLVGALPGPATWNELAKAIAARPEAKGDAVAREIGLRLLSATLNGDAAGRTHEVAALQTQAENADADKVFFYKSIMEQLSQALVENSDDPDMVLQSLQRELDQAQPGQNQSLQVPNLVPLVGAVKAEAFLRGALVRPVTLNFDQPNDTCRLAQKLALELADQLKVPQWNLVNSLDAVDLYEALDKRFGQATNDVSSLPGLPGMNLPPAALEAYNSYGNNGKSQADVYYFLGLISKDRAKDAIAVAKKIVRTSQIYLPDEAFNAMEHAGYTTALDNFFYELLSGDPGLPYWDEYVQLAAKAGQTDRMLALARSAAAQEDLSKNKKMIIQSTLFKALLAADNVDEAVQEMRRLISLGDPAPGQNGDSTGHLGVVLAQIGFLLQKPDWTEEGINVAKKSIKESSGNLNPYSWGDEGVAISLADLLWKLKRGPEAEAVLTDALANAAKNSEATEDFSWNGGGPEQHCLVALATLYHKAGRPQDVLALLENAPQWGGKDLADLAGSEDNDERITLTFLHAPGESLPISYIAADALMATGRKDEAHRIVDALLILRPGSDRGYELLLELDGTNALPKLDQLFARDQFEERPLIWKAVLLRQMGRLNEAETNARQAIAIDPSDGEEGPGDRMRAYAVLADIREDQGATNEAEFYRGVVTAIRLSESADQYYEAGLLKHAVGMYEESLTHFANAYCIQSRLAIQLASLGLNEQAEEHYRKAYELMPDSFGRVESHCFGCERVFAGERAQGIAEKVFTQLAAERPDKPQVHYLLGYLRNEEERYEEARQSFLEAVRLDPDYLNAWVKLQELSEHLASPAKQRNEVVFNILRLDPLHRHAQPDYKQVSDLAALWNVVDASAGLRPAAATNLLTLTASKIAIEKKMADSPRQTMQFEMMQQVQMDSAQEVDSPGAALLHTPFVQLSGQLMFGGSGNSYSYSFSE